MARSAHTSDSALDKTVEVWKAGDGWRWRVRHRNGNLIAESGEAFASRGNALRGIPQEFVRYPRSLEADDSTPEG